jgi:hypothetical protein
MRLVEMLDLFPTIVELVGVPALPRCQGVDQPPTVECLQGESYAAEFTGGTAWPSNGLNNGLSRMNSGPRLTEGGDHSNQEGKQEGKQYAFSQWPFPPCQKSPSAAGKANPNTYPGCNTSVPFRQGYTVRSARGLRLTEYVPYNTSTFAGTWPAATSSADDIELYDYSIDRWETTNFAQNSSYAAAVVLLREVLRKQYSPASRA